MKEVEIVKIGLGTRIESMGKWMAIRRYSKENKDNNNKSSNEEFKKSHDKWNVKYQNNLTCQDKYKERFKGEIEESKDNDNESSKEDYKKYYDKGNNNRQKEFKSKDKDNGRLVKTNSINNEKRIEGERRTNENENMERNGNQGKS